MPELANATSEFDHTKARLALSYGLTVEKYFKNKFSLETGVYLLDRGFDAEFLNRMLSYNGITLDPDISAGTADQKVKFSYVGVASSLRYNFNDFFVSGGLSFDFLVDYKIDTPEGGYSYVYPYTNGVKKVAVRPLVTAGYNAWNSRRISVSTELRVSPSLGGFYTFTNDYVSTNIGLGITVRYDPLREKN